MGWGGPLDEETRQPQKNLAGQVVELAVRSHPGSYGGAPWAPSA